MKTFLLKTILFASIIIGGALATDYIITEGLKMSSGKGEASEWTKIISSRLSADVIISGTSRAEHHISPAILDSVLQVNTYNFGMDGMPFSMQWVKLKIFEKYHKKPRLIIQEVGLSSLSKEIQKDNELLPFIKEDLLRTAFENEGFSTIELCMPAYRYNSPTNILRAFLEFFHLKHFAVEQYKGYEGFDKTWEGYVLPQDSIAVQRDPEIVELFDTFLSDCKANGIQVILVFTPQFIKMTEFTKNREKEMQIYHSFAAQYNIPFLDYSHDPLCYDTNYFFDANHLNKKGAELFTLKLATDIKEQNLYEKRY